MGFLDNLLGKKEVKFSAKAVSCCEKCHKNYKELGEKNWGFDCKQCASKLPSDLPPEFEPVARFCRACLGSNTSYCPQCGGPLSEFK